MGELKHARKIVLPFRIIASAKRRLLEGNHEPVANIHCKQELGGISMRYGRCIAIAGSIAVWSAGAAFAAEMTGAEIKQLISGNTAYVETTPESVTGAVGNGAIYYGPDGNGLYKTPKGELWHGTWKIDGNTLCTVWKEGPKRPCLKFDKQGNAVNVIDAETGKTRVKILKTARGNAEHLG